MHLQINAQNNPKEYVVRTVTGVSGSSEVISLNNSTYFFQQSIGQAGVIGTFSDIEYVLRQGFIQPNVISKIIETDIPLNLVSNVYPNPFIENISLSFNEEIRGNVSVEVFDMLGRLIFSKNYLASQNLNVILRNLPVADYILKVTANRKQLIKKILKI
jgi:hypothetical protein